MAEGDKVAARFLCSGTQPCGFLPSIAQRGEWHGHPARGRRFERVAEVYVFRLQGGRIAQAWGLEDNLARLRQLGLANPTAA